jgi:hypothetical protein
MEVMMEKTVLHKMMKIKEAAEFTGLTPTTIRRLALTDDRLTVFRPTTSKNSPIYLDIDNLINILHAKQTQAIPAETQKTGIRRIPQ